MLPSLYVEYMNQENLDSIVKVQEGYVKDRSYQGLQVKNPTGSASVEIPYVGNKIYLAGKAFRIAVELNDKELLEMVCQLRDAARSAESFADIEMPDMDIERSL